MLKRTAFILGAGASCPYGFPTGYQLVTKILYNVRSTTDEVFELVQAGAASDVKEILQFGDAVRHSVPGSIDDFLEHRSEFLRIGKAAIAQALIPHENETTLFNRENQQNWYALIFDALKERYETIEPEMISFVTFNYDRSLEHYLFTVFQNYFRLTTQKCIDIMNKLPIVHVYGHLGPLGWQADSNRPYDHDADATTINFAASHLSLIHEERASKDSLELARTLISKAERVRFLGFGYLDANMERLAINTTAKGKSVAGTSWGLTRREKSILVQKYPVIVSLDEEDNRSIVRFFREFIGVD